MTSLIFDEVSSPLLVLPIYSTCTSVKVVMDYVGEICRMVNASRAGISKITFHVIKLQAIFAK